MASSERTPADEPCGGDERDHKGAADRRADCGGWQVEPGLGGRLVDYRLRLLARRVRGLSRRAQILVLLTRGRRKRGRRGRDITG